MIITNKLTMELTHNSSSPVIYAVQDDKYSRCLELTLLANGSPWVIPEDAAVLIRYLKSDGKGGEYDTLPDENPGWTAEENVLTLTLAPQVLTCPGVVNLSVTLMRGQMQVSTFAILICVEPSVGAAAGGSEEYFHVPGFLPAPRDASVGQFLQVSAVDAAGHVTGLKAASIGENALVTVEPSEDDIPKVFFGAALPQTKDEAIMTFRYISRTEDISGWCKTKAQGNSSMQYPKKNQTVKLYKNADCTEKLKVGFKDWGKQNKFCFKANWVDPTHARNIVCANLWDEVVSSRSDYDTLPEELRNSPRNGAVDGFPVKLYADEIYQGVYTLNIPKDAWMFNMDEDNPDHVLMCAETNTNGVYAETPCNFRALWDGTNELHWSVEVGTNGEAVKTALNNLIQFVMDHDGDEFKNGIGNYLDVQSAIDYYLHQYVINGTDGLAKNMLLATYNGTKWHCSAYDMDGVFHSMVNNPCPEGYAEQFSLLWERIATLYAEELTARYKELRQTVYAFANMCTKLENFIYRIGTELYEEDREIFPGLPTGDDFNVKRIREYIRGRLIYCDSKIGQTSEPMYKLGSEIIVSATAWTGTVETDIKLFDEPKSFTVICEATIGDNATPLLSNLWSCTNDHTALPDAPIGWAGIGAVVDTNGGFRFGYTPDTWANASFITENINGETMPNYSKHAMVVTDGVITALYQITEKGGSVKAYSPVSGQRYVQHDGRLMLGMRMYSYGGNHLFDGTIHSFEVWDYAMTEEEIRQKLV